MIVTQQWILLIVLALIVPTPIIGKFRGTRHPLTYSRRKKGGILEKRIKGGDALCRSIKQHAVAVAQLKISASFISSKG